MNEMIDNKKSLRVIRMSRVCEKTGLCQSTIYDLINRGLFPIPFELVPGGRARGWFENDVDHYLEERKSASIEAQAQALLTTKRGHQ